MTRAPKNDFPDAQKVRAFLESSDPISLRQLCKAFHIPANRQKDFKDWLRKQDFRVIRGHVEYHPRPAASHDLPEVLVVEVGGPDEHGETVARPVDERHARLLPIILLPKDAPAPGSRALIRMEGEGRGRVIRALTRQTESVLCVVRHIGSQAVAVPTQRSRIPHYRLDEREAEKLASGVMVRVQPNAGGPRFQDPTARILEVLPQRGEIQKLGDIAIAEQGIPHVFSAAALEIAENGEVPKLGQREDLREIPLVTIDGEDARDFDDAVFAEPDGKGWHILVAIADVAHYVPAASALDEEALDRGNSVYLADQVVPMLPEALSNGLCSLKPHEERACLAVHLWIDAHGNRKEYRFCRGLMRSHARLTYTQVDAFLHHEDAGAVPPALHKQVKHLHGAFKSFMEARHKRGTLELEIPEFRVVFEGDGKVKDILRRPHLESHRLIEEFMIAANVAAAELIEKEKLHGLFRVHEPPSTEKLSELEHLL
ncbi:MAG: RNB domain-containing ribonuclease, partial [Alphaproteobacteria bacterium]|nr:RNB domain-containing ribonuclease [Alphaproteobacteria bacterium]